MATMGRRAFLRAVGTGAAGLAGLGAMGCLGAAGGGAGAAAGPSNAGVGIDRPNVIIIFTDDQGYQDVGCFGSPKIRTRNLDRMASEGMRLTDFYVAAPVCTPSRAALLTGCYPRRVGLERGVLFPDSKTGLNPAEITLAEVLKGRGYATACIGKWHLGHHPSMRPLRQGFDRYLGVPYSNDMWLAPDMTFAADAKLGAGLAAEVLRAGVKDRNKVPLLADDEVIEYPVDQTTLTGRYTDEAVRFIGAHKGEPFFIYMAHSMPHVPLAASAGFKGKSPRGLYGDVIEEMDASVGRILAALKDAGLDGRTLVFFTSDNGPWLTQGARGGCALPLRGGKGTTYDGGLREPTICRWPGKVPAGAVCREVATSMDLMPTLARLAGGSAPTDRVIDGKDIWPLLAGRPGAASPHEAFFYYSMSGRLSAVRSGRWKLHVRPSEDYVQPKKPPPGTEPPPWKEELYDLEADIGETRNVLDAHADVVARLKGLVAAHDAEIARNRRPVGRVAGEAKAG